MARDGLKVLGRSKTSTSERPKLRKPAPPRSKSFNDRKVRNSRRVSVYGQKGLEKRQSRRTSIYIDPDNARWEIVRPRTSGDHDSLWGSDVEEEDDDTERPKTAGNDSARRQIKVTDEDGLPHGFVPDPARFPARTTSKLRVPSQELIGLALGSPTHVPLMTTMTTFDQSPRNTEGGSPLPVLPQHRMTLRADAPVVEQQQQQQSQLVQQQPQSSPSKPSPTKAESMAGTQQKGSWKKLLGKGIFSKRTSGGSSNKKSMDIIDEDKEAAHDSGSLLSIDIPQSNMERYSVMFNSVLNPSPPSPEEPKETQPRRTIFERRIERDNADDDRNYIVSDETPSSSPPQLRLSPKTPRNFNPEYYTDVLPLSLFPRTPRTPRTPHTPPDEDKLEELRKTLVETLGALNPDMEPKTPMELQRELSPAFTRKSRRPESDIVPSLMMILQNQQFDIEDINRKSNLPVALSPNNDIDIFRGPLSPFSVISETSSVDIALEDGIAVSDFPDPPSMVRLGAEQAWNWDMLTTPLRARTPVSAKIESPAPEPATAEINAAAAKDEAERLIASAASMSISRQISMSQRQLNLPIVPDADRLYFRPTRLDTMSSDVPFEFGLNGVNGDLPPMSAVQAVGDVHGNYI